MHVEGILNLYCLVAAVMLCCKSFISLVAVLWILERAALNLI